MPTYIGQKYGKRGEPKATPEGKEAYRLRAKVGMRWGQIAKKLEFQKESHAFNAAKVWALEQMYSGKMRKVTNYKEWGIKITWPVPFISDSEQMFRDRLDGESWEDISDTFNMEIWKARCRVRSFCKNRGYTFPDKNGLG
tara:strand:- start:4492 stop:4911 length:420 start_codon:yes stop_codon:yes gene_type:complete